MLIEKTRTALAELMARRLDDTRLAVMVLDGLQIADRVHVVGAGDHDRGGQGRARAVGGQHGGCDAGPARYRLTITIPVRSPSKFHDDPDNLTIRRAAGHRLTLPTELDAERRDNHCPVQFPLSPDLLHRLPRHPDWRYELVDGEVWLSPRPRPLGFVRSTAVPVPAPRVSGVEVRAASCSA